MKKIVIKKNTIDIPLVDENDNIVKVFSFDQSDEHINEFYKTQKKAQEIMSEIKEDEEEFEKTKEFLKGLFDKTFHDGDFDFAYAINPSLLIVATYFLQLCQIVAEEINPKKAEEEIFKQYLEG